MSSLDDLFGQFSRDHKLDATDTSDLHQMVQLITDPDKFPLFFDNIRNQIEVGFTAFTNLVEAAPPDQRDAYGHFLTTFKAAMESVDQLTDKFRKQPPPMKLEVPES